MQLLVPSQMIVFVADSEAEKRMWLAEVGRTITSLIDPYLKKKRTDTIHPNTSAPQPPLNTPGKAAPL